MKTKNIAYVLIGLGCIGSLVWFGFIQSNTPSPKTVTPPVVLSFKDCLAAGYPVMETFPRQCKTPDGRTFAEELPQKITYVHASADLVVVTLPFPGAVTGKEFKVTGQARGTWFFEGSFPVEVLDAHGKVIATGVAQAKGEWTTSNFVPFSADIKVPTSYTGPATLVLKKDNPSGDTVRDASVSFPITIEY